MTKIAREESAPRSPGRPSLPVDRILDTALQIVDEEGADALSMRTLAQRLNSGTATLYRHYANRAELVEQVVDRVLGEVQLDVDAFKRSSWQEACMRSAHATFAVIVRHRNVAPLLAENVPVGPHAMVLRERLIAVLLANGFPPRLAALAYATLARHVVGFATQLRGNGKVEPDDSKVSARFRRLARTEFPATLAVARFLPVPLEEEFAFGMKLVVTGLELVLAAGSRAKP
ncbi:MAG: TetR/AcrR family transcriptional regulator [Burkholderiales bacterium]